MVKLLKLLCQKNKNDVEEAKVDFLTDNKRANLNLGQVKTSLAIIVASLDISKGIAESGKLSNQGINQQKLHKQTLLQPEMKLKLSWMTKSSISHIKIKLGWLTQVPPSMLLLGMIYSHPILLEILVWYGWEMMEYPKLLAWEMFLWKPILDANCSSKMCDMFQT